MRLIDADVLEAELQQAIALQETMAKTLGIDDDEAIQAELKAYRRSAWIYAIVCGWDYEDSWDEVAKKFGWDEEDRKRANMMHEQWMKAKEAKDQPEIVRCRERVFARKLQGRFICTNTGHCQSRTVGLDWFCADGKRK